MMFECRKETINVDGQKLVIRELSADQLVGLDESAISLVQAGIFSPKVTIEQVGSWPSSIVTEIASAISKLNGFEKGNA
tara:strand:+ start:1365 stop:1601 length:237 start_codon:yes stop_codon:yes gene_type:complete